MKGKFGLDAKFESISADNLYLSEISLAELKFGVEKSEKQEKNRRVLSNFYQVFRYCLFITHSISLLKKRQDYIKPVLH
jgi:tRNA(fMet)-specific endonuclease VapC